MPESPVLFDLDGTLVDTAGDFLLVVNQLRSQHKKTPLVLEALKPTINGGAAAMAALAFGVQVASKEQREQFLQIYQQCLGVEAGVYPGLTDLINELQQTQHPWGIITNKHQRFARPLIDKLGLKPHVLVCGDQVDLPKPAPEALLLAADQLDCLPEQCIYCGDHRRDMEAAINAGYRVALAAAYGYLAPFEEVDKWPATSVAQSSDALARLIRSHLSSDLLHP